MSQQNDSQKTLRVADQQRPLVVLQSAVSRQMMVPVVLSRDHQEMVSWRQVSSQIWRQNLQWVCHQPHALNPCGDVISCRDNQHSEGVWKQMGMGMGIGIGIGMEHGDGDGAWRMGMEMGMGMGATINVGTSESRDSILFHSHRLGLRMEERMFQSFGGGYSCRWIQLQHCIQKIKRIGIDFAEVLLKRCGIATLLWQEITVPRELHEVWSCGL